MILRGEDVAARPAHVRAEVHEGLDEHGGLDGHVQRTGDPDALERLLLRILSSDGHEAGHLVLGDDDFLAAPLGEGDVADLVVVLGSLIGTVGFGGGLFGFGARR